MSKQKPTRRDFVKRGAAAVVSVGAIGFPVVSAYAGQQGGGQGLKGRILKGRITPQPQMKAVQLNRSNLANLSNKLYNSPAERKKFLASPQRYADSVFGGRVVDEGQLQDIKNMLASGFCCGGCGC